MKILVVDSKKTVGGIIADMLIIQGHEVFELTDGKDVIEIYTKNVPEVVILDISIKDVSPIDVLDKIRSISMTTQIILLTEFGFKEIEEKVLEFNIFETIDRNIGSELFLKLINKFIRTISEVDTKKDISISVKHKILVVDDSFLIRKMLQDFLIEKKYEVITANDGEQALDKIKNGNPDLVLLDITMPKMDGIEVLKHLKNLNINIPVIMITSNTDIEIAKKTLSLGAYDYIAKPINFEYLETSIIAKIMHKTYK